MITLGQPNWTFTFNNDFAQTLRGALSERTLQDRPSRFHPCACCSVLVDPEILPEHRRARLSEVRVAS